MLERGNLPRSLALLDVCLDEGIFFQIPPSTEFYERYIARFNELSRPFLDEVRDAINQGKGALVASPDFNWEIEAKRALRNSIQTIYDSGIIDRDLLADASKFVAPGNLRIVEGERSSWTRKGEYYLYIVSLQDSPDTLVNPASLPVPQSKEIRDKYVSMDIGTATILEFARERREAADEIGLPMRDDQAIDIAFAEVTGHEYGHGIDSACGGNGIDTFERSHTIRPDKLSFEDQLIHQEHLARVFQDMARKKKMMKLGYSEEEIERFSAAFEEPRLKKAEAVRDFIRKWIEKGLSFDQLISSEMRFVAPASTALGVDKEDISSIRGTLWYSDVPYTEKQARMLVSR